MLAAPVGGKQARIVLPGRYAVTPATIDRIRVMRGVVQVEEA